MIGAETVASLIEEAFTDEAAMRERAHYIRLIKAGIESQSKQALDLVRECGLQVPE